ncbi:MAG: vacuolar family H+-ATPase subunit H [Lachnospiraceae bacterium]|nr:vacuolar family H+-ATPase subunit H [Lachnospiraceae bacterium]
MNSRIEQLIDELEEYIESCKPKFMSSSEIIVNKEEIDELLRELRMKTPDEIRRYQKIISNKEAILNDARAKAQALIDEATVHTNELISEHEIMQQAYAQANGIVATAARQAQEILDKATMEANELRMQASRYTEERLGELESIVLSAIQSSSANYDKLLGSLGQYRDLIQSNIRSLHPVEDDLDGIPMDRHSDDDGLDVL